MKPIRFAHKDTLEVSLHLHRSTITVVIHGYVVNIESVAADIVKERLSAFLSAPDTRALRWVTADGIGNYVQHEFSWNGDEYYAHKCYEITESQFQSLIGEKYGTA